MCLRAFERIDARKWTQVCNPIETSSTLYGGIDDGLFTGTGIVEVCNFSFFSFFYIQSCNKVQALFVD